MSKDLKSLIDSYKSDDETVYSSWFVNNDERLKAFRTIRRGVFDVIQDIKNGLLRKIRGWFPVQVMPQARDIKLFQPHGKSESRMLFS